MWVIDYMSRQVPVGWNKWPAKPAIVSVPGPWKARELMFCAVPTFENLCSGSGRFDLGLCTWICTNV